MTNKSKILGCIIISIILFAVISDAKDKGAEKIRREAVKLNLAEYKIGPNLSLEFSWKTNLVK